MDEAPTFWRELNGWDDAGGDAAEGKGTCNHLNNAYAALCRCAGIKARILKFNVQFGDLAQKVLTPDPILSSFMNN